MTNMARLRMLLRRFMMKRLGLRSPSEEMARIAEPIARADGYQLLAYLQDVREFLNKEEG